MYSVNGDFGKVRHVQKPMGPCDIEVPFRLAVAGWHSCNDKYHYQRENGIKNEHLLLFSVSEGGRVKFADREALRLPADSVAWIPPRCRHAYYAAAGELWEFYWIHIQDAPWLKFEEIFRSGPVLPISRMESIGKEFEKMLCGRKKTSEEFQIEGSLLISFLYHFLLQESCLQRVDKSKGDQLVHSILRDMEAACQKEWTLTQLSEQYYISVPQLIRRFKAETGMTPYACLMNIRLKTAEMYLKHTGMTVEEISRKTGFSSTSNFILQFRKYWGLTPRKYRSNL